MRRLLIPGIAIVLATVGCGNGESVPGHTAQEQQAIEAQKKLTPEQRIAQIQQGPMPQGAKDAMIQKIKQENGIK